MKRLLLFFVVPMLAMAAEHEDLSIFDLQATWHNQRGEEVVWCELRGRPMLVCMFFSHCGYACPRITADMQAIAAVLSEHDRDNISFVMVSFDVERDTPEVLATFVETKNIDASWQLLHGDEDAVQELAAALGVRYRREPDGNFAHSNLILLLDAQGRIVHRHEGLNGDLMPITSAAGALVAE